MATAAVMPATNGEVSLFFFRFGILSARHWKNRSADD